jgi:hypothetical protein
VHFTAKPRLPVVDGSGLVPAATIVVQAAQRQRLLERVPQEQAPKPVRDPAGKSPYRTRDGSVNDLSGEGFAGAATQAPHTVSPKLVDPDIDLALRYIESRGDLGDRPPVDKDALDDQRSPRR